ncbi:PREDICTED: uncharacterized protein LOC108555256 [Eufriesea mexicana]|uniref:uncharacterized protein LOC108555256 n=1 Tax=Eufriesea mexicana TaxID=516756 RepID=UPI00083BC5A6|nr:PREDICTED: uncharacterized protein LOC108555256 [Eufriesea mexicana]
MAEEWRSMLNDSEDFPSQELTMRSLLDCLFFGSKVLDEIYAGWSSSGSLSDRRGSARNWRRSGDETQRDDTRPVAINRLILRRETEATGNLAGSGPLSSLLADEFSEVHVIGVFFCRASRHSLTTTRKSIRRLECLGAEMKIQSGPEGRRVARRELLATRHNKESRVSSSLWKHNELGRGFYLLLVD